MSPENQPGLDDLQLSRAKVALGHLGRRNDVEPTMEGKAVVLTQRVPMPQEMIDHMVQALRADGIEIVFKPLPTPPSATDAEQVPAAA